MKDHVQCYCGDLDSRDRVFVNDHRLSGFISKISLTNLPSSLLDQYSLKKLQSS